MSTRRCGPGFGLALWLLLAAAGTARAARFEVIDDQGHRLALNRPAQRIVSLSPHATELLFAAGAGAAVVGVSRYSDYPPAARALPQVGDSSRIDLEALAALHPDLVVAWGSALPAHARAALAGLGIPVFVSEPQRLDAVLSGIRRLGHLAGREETAAAAVSSLSGRLARLRARHAADVPLRVFFQAWSAPLMTINRAQVISDVIALCGGQNVFAGANLPAATVDPEAVVRADPDAIVAGVEGGTGARDPFARWRPLTGMRAVQSGGLVALPADLIDRPGPRIVDGAERLCEALDRLRHARAERPASPSPSPAAASPARAP